MPETLASLADAIKSGNAGASLLTFDIFFNSLADLNRARRSVTASAVALLYRVPAEQVKIYPFEAAICLKVTIPRPSMFASLDERDFDGVQQHVLLAALAVT